MRIKKFTARTFAEALDLVKKELSQDAVILQTEEKKGLRPHVVVTAGIEEEAKEVQGSQFKVHSKGQATDAAHHAYRNATVQELSAEDPLRAKVSAGHSALRAPHSAMAAHSSLASSDDGVDGLRKEINGLKSLIEGMRSSGYEMALPQQKRAVLNFLRSRSVREEFALRLCDKTTDLAEIPLLISADIQVKRAAAAPKAVMFIGPTGVGKTTTIAKLAAQEVRAGRKAAIINLDTYRIGAVEQVRIYSRILGIPLATASTVDEFAAQMRRFSKDRDIVFVDTTGRNPRDEAYLDEIAAVCSAGLPIELHLLMSASTDDACMIDAYPWYRKLPIDCIGFSKLDEAVRYGALYNLLLTYQKPVSWLTTGQRVPGNIEQATVSRLAGLIVAQEC